MQSSESARIEVGDCFQGRTLRHGNSKESRGSGKWIKRFESNGLLYILNDQQ